MKAVSLTRQWPVAVIAIIVLLPLLVFAQAQDGGLVPRCNNEINPQTGKFYEECGIIHVISLANNILQFAVTVAVPIAAVAFAYAGWLYLSARGNSGQISKAHGIFLNVGIGLLITLSAWLVVDLILDALTNTDNYVRLLNNS